MNDKIAALQTTIEALAGRQPTPFPFLTAYVDLRPGDAHAGVTAYLKTALRRKGKRFPEGTEERESFDRDAEKLLAFFDEGGRFERPAGGSAAIFLCSGDGGFTEVVEYDAPLPGHALYVAHRPNLFNLAWADDRYSNYAVLALDSETARVFAFGLGEKVAEEELKGESLSRTKVGGWSQARYQRRRRNLKAEHVAEAIEQLRKTVEETGADKIVLVGHERLLSMARNALPQDLAEKVAEEVALDVNAPEDELRAASLRAFRRNDLAEDAERVSELLGELHADGLAVAGIDETLEALAWGQAEEVLVVGPLDKLDSKAVSPRTLAGLPGDVEDLKEAALQARLGDALVRRAENSGAEVRFIEKDERLLDYDGVGAFLRYRLDLDETTQSSGASTPR